MTRIAGPTRTPERVTGDTALGEGGLWLDSLDLFEAILACEESFGVCVDPSAEATVEALQTVGGLADLIRRTKDASPGSA